MKALLGNSQDGFNILWKILDGKPENYDLARPEVVRTAGEVSFHILPETNIAPKNGRLEDEMSFWHRLFSGVMLLLGSVSKYNDFNTTTKVSLFKMI